MLAILMMPGRLLYSMMARLGSRYYFAVAFALHIVILSAVYWIVIAKPMIEKEQILRFSITTGLEEFLSDKDDDALEGGKNAFPDLSEFTPGKEKEKKAEKAKEKAMTSPKVANVRNKGTSGRATVSPIESRALGNLLDGNAQTSGQDNAGGGDIPAGYGVRGKGKKGQGLATYGGGKKTEDAVALGLLWLRNHLRLSEYKDKTGKIIQIGWWDPSSFHKDARNMGARPDQSNMGNNSTSATRDYMVGVTSVALLAFLGAGNTTTQGEYTDVVNRVINYLLKEQKDGRFGGANNYNHFFATEALAEALILCKEERLTELLKVAVKAAVKNIVETQNLAGGWDYRNNKFTQRNDSSLTSLALIALKSSEYAGIDVPRSTYLKIIHHYNRLTDVDGYLFYGDVNNREDKRKGAGMLATSIFCRLMLGQDRENSTIRKQVELLKLYLPDQSKIDTLDNSYYAWFMGTLGCFFYGGDTWSQWNAAAKPALLSVQELTGHRVGSFKTAGMWCWAGGRIYSTAINVLSLEIYYRYIPGFFLKDSKKLAKFWEDEELLLNALADGEKMRQLPFPHR